MRTPLLINGELTAGHGGVFTTINPATEQPLGEAADGTIKSIASLTSV